MKLRFYTITSIYALMVSMLLLRATVVWGQHNEPSRYFSYLVDKGVKDFPKIDDNPNSDVFQLISHGKPGALLLEGKWRMAPEIVAYIKGRHLLTKAITHLNIYGCEFGKGKEGAMAVDYLEKHLSVSVAASSNITGKDGDWTLEVGAAKDVLAEENYPYNLQDFDNDGIADSVDIDDDNDGIIDEKEMTCTITQMPNKSSVVITSGISYVYHGAATIQSLVDGVDGGAGNNTYVLSLPSGSFANVTWFKFELPAATCLKEIELSHFPNQMLFSNVSKYDIQGSNDTAAGWITIAANQTYNSTAPDYATNRSAKFNMPNNTNMYKYYRIQGISGTAPSGGGWAQELYFGQNTCTDINTDGDGVVNRLDLDDDNDGITDAGESDCASAQLSSKTGIKVTSEVKYSFHGQPQSLQRLVDGIDGGLGNTDYVISNPTGPVNNRNWLEFELQAAQPLTMIELGCYSAQGNTDPLAITLTKFDANLYQTNNALIQWLTTNETEGVKYTLEKSADSKVFDYLYDVTSRGRKDQNSYNFIDKNLYQGDNFYRLKMTGPDNSSRYSEIKDVYYKVDAQWAVLKPNPTTGVITFEFMAAEAGEVSIWIDNIVGQRVLVKQITKAVKGRNEVKLDVYGLADGMYLFNYQTDDKSGVKTIKFNKVQQ